MVIMMKGVKSNAEGIGKKIGEVLNRFQEIVFVPPVIGYSKKEDDRIAAKDIYLMAKTKDKIKLIENEYAPEELKGEVKYD